MNWVSVINRTFCRTSKDNLILIISLKSKSTVCTFNPQNKSDAARKVTTPRAFVPTVPSFLPRQQYSQLRPLKKRQSTLQTVWDNSQAARNTNDKEIDRNIFWIKSLKTELRTFQLMGFKQREAKNWFIYLFILFNYLQWLHYYYYYYFFEDRISFIRQFSNYPDDHKNSGCGKNWQ